MTPAPPARQPAFSREALYEWTLRSAAGRLDKLNWVDLNANPESDPYQARRNPRGHTLFRQTRLGRTLPPAMLKAIATAELQGAATLLQGMTLAYALPEWLIQARALLWTELTPVPALLARMVVAYGISGEVHCGDDARLLRLRARPASKRGSRSSPSRRQRFGTIAARLSRAFWRWCESPSRPSAQRPSSARRSRQLWR